MEEGVRLVGVKLPRPLFDDAQRHANLHHTTISALLRDGLVYRLTAPVWPPAEHSTGPGLPPRLVDGLLATLAQQVAMIRQELSRETHPSVLQTVHGSPPATPGETTGVLAEHAQKVNRITTVIRRKPAGTLQDEPHPFNGTTSSDVAPVEPACNGRTPPGRRTISRAETEPPARVPGAAVAQTSLPPVADEAAFDPRVHQLGKRCPRRHDYRGTGQSVLRITNRHCRACDREKFHERKAAQRAAQGESA